jgi:hypothetical protein
MLSFTTALLGLYLLWVLSTLYSFTRNYLTARKTGLPLILFPFSHYNPFFMVLSVPLRPFVQKILPESIYLNFELATYGWEFRQKNKVFDKYGPAFIFVTASANELSFVDYELAEIVLRRIEDFPNTPMA